MQRLILVSADNHAGAKPAAYAEYIEGKYRPALKGLEAEEAEFLAIFGPFASFGPDALAVIDQRGAIRGGGLLGAWDVPRRLQEMDGEGVAAEVVHGGHQGATMPFFSQVNKPYSSDFRAAGARAYHRWFADCAAQSAGRIYGVADPGPCHDIHEAVRELHWVADHGFVSVGVPGIVRDAALPPLYDPYYEPFWAACVERSLVLSVHAGWGSPQGMFFDFAKHIAGDGSLAEALGQGQINQLQDKLRNARNSPFALDIGPRRVFWQLILGGVFDRHPDLRIAFTEVRADWLPATLRYLDQRFGSDRPSSKLKPSEYFRLHAYVTPSSPRPTEIAIRGELGIDRVMFGVDYPHPEGTWPNTLDWIRATLGGLPEQEARLILGENAITCYGLNRARLRAAADAIGPHSEELLKRGQIDERLIAHFDTRAGYSRPAEEVDLALLSGAVEADLSATRSGRAVASVAAAP
jgi:predicted TIM-barrel fold metal-dependent hydrolase